MTCVNQSCYMDRKRIQCLSNASHHVPIYLQPFPSNWFLIHVAGNRSDIQCEQWMNLRRWHSLVSNWGDVVCVPNVSDTCTSENWTVGPRFNLRQGDNFSDILVGHFILSVDVNDDAVLLLFCAASSFLPQLSWVESDRALCSRL